MKKCLALNIKVTTRLLIIVTFFIWLVWINIRAISVIFFSICPKLIVYLEAMFHKTIKLISSQMLFGDKVLGLIPNLAKSP